jgi:hypothetical protein
MLGTPSPREVSNLLRLVLDSPGDFPHVIVFLTFLLLLSPLKGKQQIIGTLFLAEIISEAQPVHYTKGGDLPTIIFPPIDFSTVSADTMKVKKDRELNNGRLAMIAIMSFSAAANIPGAVPALAGNPMF